MQKQADNVAPTLLAQAGWTEAPEMANELRVSERTLQRWTQNGLPHSKLGRRMVFNRSKVLSWLEAQSRNDRAPRRPRAA